MSLVYRRRPWLIAATVAIVVLAGIGIGVGIAATRSLGSCGDAAGRGCGRLSESPFDLPAEFTGTGALSGTGNTGGFVQDDYALPPAGPRDVRRGQA